MSELSDLQSQVEELRASLNALNESKSHFSLWQKIKFKLSEQGSQRGIIAILPLCATQFGLPTEDLVALFTFVLGIIGVHNFITEG
jgi:hypothetical protein